MVATDDPAERAINHGLLGDPSDPGSGEEIVVTVWRGVRLAVVLVLRHDAGAEEGSEWDTFPELYELAPDGKWTYVGSGGHDFPAQPGQRPLLTQGDPPLWPSAGSSSDLSGLYVTFAVAAVEIAAVDIHSPTGVTRSPVGHFGAVVLATEATPGELVLIGHDGEPLAIDTRAYTLRP